MTMFCLEEGDISDSIIGKWKRQDREDKAKKRAERLAFRKGCLGSVRAYLRKIYVPVQGASRHVDRLNAEMVQDVHLLHCNGDHNGRGNSGSVTLRLPSQAINLRRRGYFKIDEDDNFEDGHTSEDRQWVRLGELQVSRGVAEIQFKDPAAGVCVACHCRPVCIPAERF